MSKAPKKSVKLSKYEREVKKCRGFEKDSIEARKALVTIMKQFQKYRDCLPMELFNSVLETIDQVCPIPGDRGKKDEETTED